MNGDDAPDSELLDFKDVLSAPIDGTLPLLVGGHAVHLWALVFEGRLGDALKQWAPLASKDLDFFGTEALLSGLKRRFGGDYRLSGPRSPVIGQWMVKLRGVERKIDVLRDQGHLILVPTQACTKHLFGLSGPDGSQEDFQENPQ